VIIAPRWRKIAEDIVLCQGRLAMMTLAIAMGVFAVTAISTAYCILARELDQQYLATNPAAALLDVDHLSEAAIAGVRAQPGIAWAELGGRMAGRVEVEKGVWLPLLLFVVPDVAPPRIATLRLVAGRWPSDSGGIVLERTALAVANSDVGRDITVQTPNGPARTLHIVGAVHDPSLAPAWQQQSVYGYVTPATLRFLGEDPELRVLRLSVSDPGADPRLIEQIIINAAQWLQREGHAVGEVRIPPRHHPHQSQMTGVIRMLMIFGALTLTLSAILTATITASLLAPQVRQIAVMKTIGATTAQIAGLYVALVAAIGVIAVGVGMPLGVIGGRALAENVAHMLNFDLANVSVPLWIFAGLALAGTGLPLLLALFPIVDATRRSVRDMLNDYGGAPVAPGGHGAGWMTRLRLRDAALTLALRNCVRRRLRWVLTLIMLASAGALFATSLNTKATFDQSVIDAAAERHFDVEFRFARPADETAAVTAALAVPGVDRVEPFGDEAAALTRGDGVAIVRTYPDGGHGSLRINSLPWNSGFVSPAVIAGRWLSRDDVDSAVLNSQALASFPAPRLGDPVRITVAGRPVNLILEGVVREHMAPATIYVSSTVFARAMSTAGVTTGIRVGLRHLDPESATKATAAIGAALEKAGVNVLQELTKARLGLALAGHQFILIFILIVISALMAIVGLLGLASAMTTSVQERAREFAVLRAIGAGNMAILRSIIAEGTFVGAVSVAPAALLSVPLTMAVSRVVGASTSGSAFYFSSTTALPLWLAMILVGAAAASTYPAWRASRLTIREALTHQ
jgi:putative ABC transport system permease protein